MVKYIGERKGNKYMNSTVASKNAKHSSEEALEVSYKVMKSNPLPIEVEETMDK